MTHWQEHGPFFLYPRAAKYMTMYAAWMFSTLVRFLAAEPRLRVIPPKHMQSRALQDRRYSGKAYRQVCSLSSFIAFFNLTSAEAGDIKPTLCIHVLPIELVCIFREEGLSFCVRTSCFDFNAVWISRDYPART
jgi:hypothetical protein